MYMLIKVDHLPTSSFERQDYEKGRRKEHLYSHQGEKKKKKIGALASPSVAQGQGQ